MILLRDLLPEYVSFDKLRSVERGLKKKYGQASFGDGTFGVELEFSPAEYLDIDEIIEAQRDDVARLIANERKFDSEYEDWLQEQREHIEGRYGYDNWDDSYGPPTVEIWEEDYPEPDIRDYDDEQDFDVAHADWVDKRNDVENDYYRWDRYDREDYRDEFIDKIFSEDRVLEFVDEDDIRSLGNMDTEAQAEALDSVTEFLVMKGEKVGNAPKSDTWGVFYEHDNMIEVASRHLTMKDFNLLHNLMDMIYRHFATHGNSSAHVHVGVSNMDPFDVVAMSTLVDEKKIVKHIDPDRNFSQWAKLKNSLHRHLSSRLVTKTDGQSTIIQLSDLLGHVDRYHGTNLEAFSQHSTIEFRYFSSKIAKNPKLFFKWIKYFLLLPQIAKTRKQVILGDKVGERIILKRLPHEKVGVVFEKNFKKIKQDPHLRPADIKSLISKGKYSSLLNMEPDERKKAISNIKRLKAAEKATS